MTASPVRALDLRQYPWAGSAGRPPEELVDTSALSLGRAARTAIAHSHRDDLLAWRRGRAIVDIALSGNRCTDTLADDPLHDHDPFASCEAQPYLITSLHGVCGLDPFPVDSHVARSAGGGRGRAGAGQPHRPDPAVHPPGLLSCHPVTLMRYTYVGWGQLRHWLRGS